MKTPVKPHHLIHSKSIVILSSFLITFSLARLAVYLINTPHFDVDVLTNIIVSGHHIHHFAYGIVILAVNNFILFFIPRRYNKTWLFVLYGVGLGLIFDEFGIWIKLDPNYHQIVSLIAVCAITVFLIISAYIESLHRKELLNR